MDLLRSSLSPGEEQEFAAHRPVHCDDDEQMQSSYLEDKQNFSQNSFAEALLFAQSRAREAEEVLHSYDVRVEEAVLRALTLLDSSRHKELLCRQRLEQLKQAVFEEEERALQQNHAQEIEHADVSQSLIDDALESAVERGVMHNAHLFAHSPDPAGTLSPAATADVETSMPMHEAPPSTGLLQCAYEKLVAVAMHATSLAPACEVVAPLSLDDSSPEHSLSMQLAQAYGDLRDAQESTERHQILLQELEMVVEPVLQYRHGGVYDAPSYGIHQGLRHPPLRPPYANIYHGSSRST